jgi:hypothetical protein
MYCWQGAKLEEVEKILLFWEKEAGVRYVSRY